MTLLPVSPSGRLIESATIGDVLTYTSARQWDGRAPAIPFGNKPVNSYDLLQNVGGVWGVNPTVSAPNTNDVWSWNGSIWTSRAIGAAAIVPLQPDANTVGLWRTSGDLTNLVDPSNPLTVDTGTEIYADIVPGKKAFYFNGSTRLKVANFVPALAITGDCTVALILQLDEDPTSNTWLYGHGGNGETPPDNILYSGQFPNGTPPRAALFLSENGAGVNASYSTSAPASIPPIHNIGLFGWSRIGNRRQAYFDGVALGAQSGVLTAPDGGGSGRLYVGATDASTVCTRLLLWGIMIQNVGWTATEWRACYNQTLGPAFGTL